MQRVGLNWQDTAVVKTALLILIFLVACSHSPEKMESSEAAKLKKDHFSRFSAPLENEEGNDVPQTGTLLGRATEFESNGDYVKSVSYIERSLRIDPQNAYLWYRLANAYFKMGRYQEAIQFAQRSNSFSSRDQRQQTINENLIKHAKLYISTP